LGQAGAVTCLAGALKADPQEIGGGLPVQELRSLMISRTQEATGSASMTPSILRLPA
jgi:hypothetical protein